MGLIDDLGHRCAQPQAVLSVPVGDAQVRWRRAEKGEKIRKAKWSGHLSSGRANGPEPYQPGPTGPRKAKRSQRRNGLAICRPGGPTARSHTSLGQPAQVAGSHDFRRAEGPSHRSCTDRPRQASEIGVSVTRAAGAEGCVRRVRNGLAICSHDLSHLPQLQPAERSGVPVFPVPDPSWGDES